MWPTHLVVRNTDVHSSWMNGYAPGTKFTFCEGKERAFGDGYLFIEQFTLPTHPTLLVHLPYKWTCSLCSASCGRLACLGGIWQPQQKSWALHPGRLTAGAPGFIHHSQHRGSSSSEWWGERGCQSRAHKADVHLVDPSRRELSLQKMNTQNCSHPTLTKQPLFLRPALQRGKSCFFF